MFVVTDLTIYDVNISLLRFNIFVRYDVIIKPVWRPPPNKDHPVNNSDTQITLPL